MSNTVHKSRQTAGVLGAVSDALLITFGVYLLATGTGVAECAALVTACVLAALYVAVTR